MPNKHIGFAPITPSGKYLFSVGESYGTVEFDDKHYTIKILGNPLTLSSISLPTDSAKQITADGKPINFSISNSKIIFENVTISNDLSVEL